MKTSVMELKPEIVQRKGKEENPEGVQDLTSNASVFAEKAKGLERRWEDCDGQPSHSRWGWVIPPAGCSPWVPTCPPGAKTLTSWPGPSGVSSGLWVSPSQPPSIVTSSSLHLM